jgi:hypothetical protein
MSVVYVASPTCEAQEHNLYARVECIRSSSARCCLTSNTPTLTAAMPNAQAWAEDAANDTAPLLDEEGAINLRPLYADEIEGEARHGATNHSRNKPLRAWDKQNPRDSSIKPYLEHVQRAPLEFIQKFAAKKPAKIALLIAGFLLWLSFLTVSISSGASVNPIVEELGPPRRLECISSPW